MILVDERRLAYGIDPLLVRHAGGDPDGVLSPAAFLSRGSAMHVLRDGERRAMVRRIAATRDEVAIPAHVRRSASFAARVIAAIDRDDDDAFGGLIGEYRTLLAFVNAVDAGTALRRVLGGGPFSVDETAIAIDALLLVDDGAFAWRRLAALGEFTLEPLDLGPIAAPALDLIGAAGLYAFLRFAASESDGDARAALRSKLAPIDPDDARTLLTIAGDSADVLDVIDAGTTGGGREFAHALRTIARAYRVPDAGASEVLASAAATLGLEAATFAALERVARDFDAARILAPAWEAGDAIDEFAAELAGCTQRALEFPAFPAPAVAAEAPVPVTSRRATFSASSLNAFAECERKWFYRYVCGAVEDRGSSASFYGIAFHSALEEFHGKYARFDGDDPVALGSFLDYCIAGSFDRHRTRFDAPVEFELQKRRARRTAKRYLTWLLERARKAPFEVIGCETTTDVSLGGFAFIGFIDRIDRDDATGAVTVVDYKTGAIAKSAGEYLADVLAFHEFQLPFYYWARTAAGDNVTRLSLVPLKDAMLDVEPIELTVVAQRPPLRPGSGQAQNGRARNATTAAIGVADLERARDRMIAIAATLAVPTIGHYAVTRDPDACRYCAYKDACRERPAVAEERFGR
jgi:RecB family exonuclease